jgi:hypothetical protein
MGFFDIFFGTPQSLYASYAILAAVITICITILLTGTDLTLGNRFLFIFLVVLMLIPSVFLTLFQITCMVTGGNKNSRWWCWLYAWIMSVFIIIYCVFVIIVSFTSLFTYTNAINKVDNADNQYKMNPETSNEYAKSMIENFETSNNNNLPPGLPPPGAKSRADVQSNDEKHEGKFSNYSQENFEEVTYMSLPKPGDKAKPKVDLPPEEIPAVLPSTASFTDYDDKYANF